MTEGPNAAQDALDAVEAVANAAEDAVRAAPKTERHHPGPDAHAATEATQRTTLEADQAQEQAKLAEAQAVAAAEQTDGLLLDPAARATAAQVSPERPFGLPGQSVGRGSALRLGFTVTVGGLLALALGRAFVIVEHQLLLVLIAAFVAIGLDPAVTFLVRHGLRRGLAVAIIAVTFLAAVGGFAAAAVPPLVKQAVALGRSGPGYLQQLKDRHSLLGRLNLQYHLTDRLKSQVSGGGAVNAAGGVLHAGTVVLSATFETIIVLVLVIYFLADIAKIKTAFYRLWPRHRRPRVGLLGDEVISRVGGYVLGNVLTSIVAIAGNYVVLLLLHAPYALVLSVLVGILDLVPLVGSTVGGAIVALVVLATVSGPAAIITVSYHVVYRLFEDYVLNPRVLRKTVDVSPVVTVVAVLLGGSLLGIAGAVIAVPAAAAVQLLLQEVLYPMRDADVGPDDGTSA